MYYASKCIIEARVVSSHCIFITCQQLTQMNSLFKTSKL